MTQRWQKYYPLTDKNAFICLVDHMGNDDAIVQAARVSYGKDEQDLPDLGNPSSYVNDDDFPSAMEFEKKRQLKKDRNLIRYLMNHSHTTPFEMVEIKFMVQVPMDCWRQWVRHRTASINEYSTRYTEALDFFQVTDPTEWRLQSTDNKQGSSGFLPQDYKNQEDQGILYGEELTRDEMYFHERAKQLYQDRLNSGVAKEQARKDLPLSTYTRAYWKCDLHNIFNFLRLRMDSHAQLEIRQFANCMFEIVKQICPVACEAFEDYVLHAKRFSRMELETLKQAIKYNNLRPEVWSKPDSMADREWKEFLGKIS